MSEELRKKVETSIKLLKTAARNDIVEICYSGGKDSDVILALAKMAGIRFRAIYKNTTIDPPGTIKHCLENNVEIIRPKLTFLQLVEKKGFPSRRVRFCCSVLKEYKILDKSVQGIRKSESIKRNKNYSVSEPIKCRIFGSKKNHVNVILPILSWSNRDISEFIEAFHIKCHPLYYDEVGKFHPERRLGCLGCPLKSDNGKSDFKKYPVLLKQIVKAGERWFNKNSQKETNKKFNTIYEVLAHCLFFKSYQDWKLADDSLFGKTDWKELLEQYFNIKF